MEQTNEILARGFSWIIAIQLGSVLMSSLNGFWLQWEVMRLRHTIESKK